MCSRRARVGVRKAKSELKISAPISRAKYLENVQPTAFVWSDLLQLFCHCYPRRTSSSSLRARAPGRIRVVMSASDGTNGTKSLYGDKERASEVRSCVRKSSAVDSERTRRWGAVFRSFIFPRHISPPGTHTTPDAPFPRSIHDLTSFGSKSTSATRGRTGTSSTRTTATGSSRTGTTSGGSGPESSPPPPRVMMQTTTAPRTTPTPTSIRSRKQATSSASKPTMRNPSRWAQRRDTPSRAR